MELKRDKHGTVIQGFSPSSGKEIGEGTYQPEYNEAVILGDEVSIAIDGVIVMYSAGTLLVLNSSTVYTFGADVPVHVM